MNPTCSTTDTRFALTGMVAAVLALTSLAATAQEAPLAHIADPSVFKVLSENDQFRVLLATWRPGQRDAFHSHSARASYPLTTCDLNLYLAKDSTSPVFFHLSQASARTHDVQLGHSIENIGKSDCKALIVERK